MKKNKLILFDWGNIVESFSIGYSCKDAWKELFKLCGYKKDEDIFEKLSKYNTTSIKDEKTFENVYISIKEEFELNAEFNEFKKNYYKCFENIYYFKDVRDYELSLKDKCYIGILSNLTIFDKDRLDKQVGLNNYDYVFLSFEIGLKKPNIEIFEEVQKELPFSKEDILFIDDGIKNIETAKEFGWNTLCATGQELDKIKNTCEDFLRN